MLNKGMMTKSAATIKHHPHYNTIWQTLTTTYIQAHIYLIISVPSRDIPTS